MKFTLLKTVTEAGYFTSMRFLTLRGLRPVLQMIALSIFAYQMMQATEKYLYPFTIPSTETKDIKDSKLPNIFYCEKNQTSLDNFAFVGYDGDFLNYLKGISLDYYDITWVGHYNGSSFAEISEELFTLHSDLVGIYGINYTTSFTIFNGFCKKLDITAERLTEVVQFSGYLGDSEVLVNDPGTALHYIINTESFTGDKIEPEYGHTYYALQLEEIHWNREVGECMDYGVGETFETYADCIENEHDKTFHPLLGCEIPWLSAPGQFGMCEGFIPMISSENYKNFEEEIVKIYNHRLYKISGKFRACPKPCIEVRIQCQKTYIESSYLDYSYMYVYFESSTKVTKHILAYGLFEMVVDIGSSLGLWIGLSALGIFDLLLDVAVAVKEKWRELMLFIIAHKVRNIKSTLVLPNKDHHQVCSKKEFASPAGSKSFNDNV